MTTRAHQSRNSGRNEDHPGVRSRAANFVKVLKFRASECRLDGSVKRRSAFTLIEIMVAVALFGIVMATVGPNLRRSSVSTKGAALALAAALTEVRQQAITQQVPVALVIPSGNGTQGQANSYYIASGEQPRITQVKRLAANGPNCS